MRVLITGASGMLGRDLLLALRDRDVTALSRVDLDITHLDSVRDALAGHDVVVNAAAYTSVDDAETHEDAAYAVNANGPENLATAANEHGARLIQISTDYVFDGEAREPYAEDARCAPRSAYGRTKAAGERLSRAAHPSGTSIVRTAWLYGAHGSNFARTMLRLAGEREKWAVIDDQIGQPTWSHDLAHRIVEMIDKDVPAGVYHGTNSGSTSWYGFAREILRDAGLDPDRVTRTDSGSFVRPAPRPSFSVLGHDGWSKVGLAPMRPWDVALADAVTSGALTA
ncbi:dTDP-4-dehydrorhamnose reductase [Agromyces sp. Soil535]|uniref:dTDP-4-dehydrorhamnose reductase n=1 Tax=Agromyces sp. Soil535 TaxID=1736390 RepID=UPI0006F4EA6D|nr:dTDP-4-dehydrorhamnose reductase [Agromyces sp. Soil535]KRE26031.1 NAD(P)-dependent oxidoreductase [Agromyces sp. Soil535]